MKHKSPKKHSLSAPTSMGGQPGGRIGNPIAPFDQMQGGAPMMGNLPADGNPGGAM